MIQEIKHDDQLLAIIVFYKFSEVGVSFFTEGDLSQQLAFMKHPKGKTIQPHVHNLAPREVQYT